MAITVHRLHILVYNDKDDRTPIKKLILQPEHGESIMALGMNEERSFDWLERARTELEAGFSKLLNNRCEVYYEI